jgi:hypothetical protein
MFSLNQIRDLFFLHLHRSDLKQLVEVDHDQRMTELNTAINKVDGKLPGIREMIGAERKSVVDMIDAVKYEENQFRLKLNLEIMDITSKINLLIKEMKQSSQMVKLGEK